MTDDDEPKESSAELNSAGLEYAARRNRIPTTAFLQPCAQIQEEGIQLEGVQTLDKRWSALSRNLPLRGVEALARTRSGELAGIARLRAELPWLKELIDWLAGELERQLWAGRPWLQFAPVLLVGPPGCGKSHFARAVGRAAAVPLFGLDMSATDDARTLAGTARGWTNAQPCFPAVSMAQAGCANPILVLDELEKSGGSGRNGDPKRALLNMVEPVTARAYYDVCLLAEVDISHVNWICTANQPALIAPLLSRLKLLEVRGPGPEHYETVLGSIYRDLAAEWRVGIDRMPDLPGAAHKLLRKLLASDRSVRRMAAHVRRLVALSAGPPQTH